MGIKKLNRTATVLNNVKRGWTVADFCAKYECTEEEFRSRIETLFSHRNAQKDVWRDILANEKIPRKEVEESEEIVGEITTQPETVEQVVDSTDSASKSLEELRAEEIARSSAVINLEVSYQTLASMRHELRKAFQSRQQEMLELRSAYEAKCHEAEKIIREDGNIVTKMNEIAAEYREERATLESLRQTIDAKSKITIGVDKDGVIALMEGEVVEGLDDTGYEELYAVLREREEAEDFRPRDLRVATRLIKIVTRLSVPFDVVFDVDDVRDAYEKFRK